MTTFKADAAHSEILFKVKHMMITNVTGSFLTFESNLESEKEDFSDAKITFEAATNSINTGNEQRDAHLKSADFFDAENFPAISFESTSFTPLSGDNYELTGNITLKGVTAPIKLDVEYGGTATDPYGQVKAGFEIIGKLNRKDFGLNWSAITEAGGIVVGEEVKIAINIQMIKQ